MKAEIKLKIREDLAIGHDIEYFCSECHTHNFYEFLYIVRGKSLNVVNDHVQLLTPKSLIVVRPDDMHYIRAVENPKEKYEFFNLQVPVEFMNQQFEQSSELKETILTPEIPVMIHLSNTEFGTLCAKTLDLDEHQSKEKRNYLYFSLIREMCACVLRASNDTYNNKTPKWFLNLIRKLEESDAETLEYEQILSWSGVSKSQLWRIFKRYLGKTPSQYVNEKKIKAAYDRILATDESFTTIAVNLKYESYTHFYNEFVKYFGYSPRTLRKRNN